MHGYLARQLGRTLTEIRTAAGKSQRAEAAELEVAHNTLRELELGNSNPTLARVEAYADRLGYTVEIVLTRKTTK